LPGPSKTLAPGQSFQLSLQRVNLSGAVAGAIASDVISWTVNGNPISSLDPADGNLTPDLTLLKATYTAPSVPPARNPIAITATIKTEDNTKSVVMLICNVTILSAQYKITADFEATGPQGISYKFKGESYTNLQALADGTYMLEPVDKTREMDLTIEQAAMTDHCTFIGPKSYKIPFLFTIDKMDPKHPAPASARLALVTVCPMKGQVKWIMQGGGEAVTYTCDIDKGSITYSPGATQQLPYVAGQPFAMNGMTYLDILQYFGPSQAQNMSSTNQANASELRQFAQRMQAHQGDSNYFKTAQGKADLQKMQALQKQLGNSMIKSSGEGAIYKVGQSQTPLRNPQADPKMMPGMARIRVQDTFDPKSSDAFNGSVEGTVGPIQADIKVRVEKLQ
jgi:hypothetical protein